MSQPLGRATRTDVTLHLGPMVALKVSIFTAVAEDRSSALKTVCTNQHPISTIRQKYVCPVCSADSGFGKARDEGNGLVLLPQEIIDNASAADLAFSKDLDLTVHPVIEVTSQLQPSGKNYYLNVQGNGMNDVYASLAQLVASRSDLAFMARFTIKTAVATYRLVVAGEDTMVLQQMADPALTRQMPVVAGSAVVKTQLPLASQLADALVTPFDASDLGRRRSAVLAEYTKGQVPVLVGEVPAAGGGSMLDLQAAFLAGIAQAGAVPVVKVKKPRAPRAPRTADVAKAS